MLGDEIWNVFGVWALNLLRAILLAKPLMMIMCRFSEIKNQSFIELRKYILSQKQFSIGRIKNILFTLLRFFSTYSMKYRRLLGITVFVLAFTHGGIFVANRINTWFWFLSQWWTFWILAGYISLLFLFVWYITSNNYSIKLFKNKRKLIQQSAYLGLIFVVLHLLFLNPWEYIWHLILLILYMYLKLVEKNKLAFVIK